VISEISPRRRGNLGSADQPIELPEPRGVLPDLSKAVGDDAERVSRAWLVRQCRAGEKARVTGRERRAVCRFFSYSQRPEIAERRNGIFNHQEANRSATGACRPAAGEAVRDRGDAWEVLGYVFQHAQSSGTALAGQPFTRYIDWGPGLLTIEAGMPVAAHTGGSPAGDVRAETLPGGLVATTTHTGPYDKLNEAHAAVQQWIEAERLTPAGAPWEIYVTDPADFPDPKDWKTEIVWPLAQLALVD
jgi:effector-binding domain-containing protein